MGDEVHCENGQPDRVFEFFQAAIIRVRIFTQYLLECRLPGPCLLYLVQNRNGGIIESGKKHEINDIADMLVHLSG